MQEKDLKSKFLQESAEIKSILIEFFLTDDEEYKKIK